MAQYDEEEVKLFNMPGYPYLMAFVASLIAGLDRTAIFQLMISRPIVAAPMTGWLLGDAATGLQIGALLELLWLGRIPVGASIPPDDTQVAVGSTCLAITQYLGAPIPLAAFSILCLLVALPFGKVGEFFDRVARRLNSRLWVRAEQAVERGQYSLLTWLHLQGACHFGLASIATFSVILLGGLLSLHLLVPLLSTDLTVMLPWLRLAIPLVGVSACLCTVNFRPSIWVYSSSFIVVYGLLQVFG
ncbi:MAG: PTS sugar transporter subunit IIC [Pedobacter sp.]